MQSGLNLSHSQDRYFIKHLVDSAGVILDQRYKAEWTRLSQLTQRDPADLVEAFHKYMTVLARSQHDTYTSPFEHVHANMALGLDIVTAESLFGYEPQQLTEYYRNNRHTKPNQYTTESVILPDTSSFLQHTGKQKPTISFPKYNNYMQDKHKFDRHTRILVPLDMLGISAPDKNEVISTLGSEHRAIVSYAQYRDVGAILREAYDETVTRRWGVDIQIATPVLSLAILVPSTDESPMPKSRNYDPAVSAGAGDVMGRNVMNTSNMGAADMVEVLHVDGHPNAERPATHEDIKIVVHDLDADQPMDPLESPDMKIHTQTEDPFMSPSSTSPSFAVHVTEESKKDDSLVREENEATYSAKERRLVKRAAAAPHSSAATLITTAASATDQVIPDLDVKRATVYRSVGSPHLSQPIMLQMLINVDRTRFGPRSNPQCVRWNGFSSSWTRLGCQTHQPDYEALALDASAPITVNCSCSHISNYAVIVDVIDPEYIPEPSLLIQITSCSAFLVSLPVLLSVLIALALLRGMQTNSNTIHQNLVMCVFVAEVLFFVGMQSRRNLVDNELPCKVIAIGLHYAWLAAFAWTTVDCIHLYRMLTEMRDINHGPMGFYFSLGYGAPAVVVGLSVGVRAHEYGNSLL